jgi:phage terminase small subunit
MADKSKGKGQKAKASTKASSKKAASKSRKNTRRDPAAVERFVEEKARPGASNGDAAVAAGLTDNPDSARVIGHEIMQDEDVRTRIAARTRELLEHARVESGEIVGLLASHMRGDMADLLPEDAFLAQAKLRGVSGLIKELEITESVVPGRGDQPAFVLERRYKIKLHSSQEAAAKLGALMKDGFGEGEGGGQTRPLNDFERAARAAGILERGRLRLVGKPS